MNKELQYGIQGLLMAFAFFACIKIFQFFSDKPFVYTEDLTQQGFCGVTDPAYGGSSNYAPSKGRDGKALFYANCASCNAIYKQLTGPALAGVTDRVPDKEILRLWIRNSEKILQSKDPYFVDLYERFNKTAMNEFSGLSDNEIDAIIEYIEFSSKAPIY